MLRSLCNIEYKYINKQFNKKSNKYINIITTLGTFGN